MCSRTRSRVEVLTRWGALMTFETVWRETPSSFARLINVGRAIGLLRRFG